MDAVQKCKQEYLVARGKLLQRVQVGDKQLCVRGRVYRALSMAPQFQTPDKLPAFAERFNLLADEANRVIVEYNEAGFAYAAFAAFAAQEAEIKELPECDCEGCQAVKDLPKARVYAD